MGELEEEEVEMLRRVIKGMSTCSSILSLFVVLTYGIFAEKRKSGTSLIIFFQSIMAFGLDSSFMIAGYFGDQLKENQALCFFQAGGLMFFGEAIQFCWFFVALNLFLRVRLEREELGPFLPLLITVVGSSIATSVVFLTDSITYDGVWCFIESTNYAVLFTCFYGVMITLSLIGTPLWVAIIWKMVNLLIEERQISRRPSFGSKKAPSLNSSNSSFLEQPGEKLVEIPHIGFSQKLVLLLRQAFYVTGFLVVFYVMLANRLSITFSGYSFTGWLIHAIGFIFLSSSKPLHSNQLNVLPLFRLAIGVVGIYLFLVFGFTERNLELWMSLLFGRRNSPEMSLGSSVLRIPTYQAISPS